MTKSNGVTRIRSLGLVALVMTLVSWTWQAKEQETKQEDKAIKIPFTLSIGQILVEGKINDKGPYNFIFDTGTNVTLVFPETAKETGISNGEQATLSLGTVSRKDQSIRVIKVNEMSKHPKDATPVHGIIGTDFIQLYLVTIDFKDTSVTFAPIDDEGARKKEMDPKHTLPITISRSLPYAEIWINEKGPFEILLDTGSNLTCVSKKIGAELKLEPEKGKKNPKADFGLKDHITEKLQVAVTDPPSQGAKSGKNGSVGNNYFCQFRTTFDLKRKEVCLVPNGYVPDYKDFVLPPKKKKE